MAEFSCNAKKRNFLQDVVNSGIDKNTSLILICRSGARSRSAAEFLTTQGYNCCYNFAEGFEALTMKTATEEVKWVEIFWTTLKTRIIS